VIQPVDFFITFRLLKNYKAMAKATQFPLFPSNDMEKRMLEKLAVVGVSLMELGGRDPMTPTYDHGAILYIFATSPGESSYVYFRVYEALQPLYEKWQPDYNSNVASLPQDKKIALLDSNMEEKVSERIMEIQGAIIPIQQLGVSSEHASPISIILWCYVFTWFDKEKWRILNETINTLLESMVEENPIENQMIELEKMIQAGVVKPTAQA